MSSLASESVNISEQYTGEKLRTKLKFFFMNPCDKFRVKRRFPWKLLAQIVKIILVTVQLALFGFERSSHVDFLEKSNVAFRHLYLKKWDPSYETMPYPPSTGVYAIYTIPEFYEYVDYALDRYNQTEKIAIGTYHFHDPNDVKPPMVMCKKHYKQGKIFAYNQTYIFDATSRLECFELGPMVNKTDNSTYYDTRAYLAGLNKSVAFDRTIEVQLKFNVTTVHLKQLSDIDTPDCFIFSVVITFHNSEHNGQVQIALQSYITYVECHGTIKSDDDTEAVKAFYVIFDIAVLIISLLSFVLCCRSMFRALKLRKVTVHYFTTILEKKLTFSDHLEFMNFWYLMIVINDLAIMVGSVLKIRIETKLSQSYELCGVLLGTGNLLVWLGCLRYLKFFDSYNVLILTMKKAAPNIFRFLVCAAIFYFGFTVCGWVVLGPYHIKFRTISTASACLFSLVNGDDMFVTFQAIKQDNHVPTYVWFFSQAYLYIFISLFIYVILNLFIAVILDTYEVIKFRSISKTSECLFSLINGDDMFVTFQVINPDGFIWWYSRIYLYSFICLFIYVVLSVFISVIMDTYETIQHYYEHGFPKTDLHTFIDEAPEGMSNQLLDGINTNGGCCAVASLRCLASSTCCCKRSSNSDDDELLTDGTSINI